jgi:hypothetical protein
MNLAQLFAAALVLCVISESHAGDELYLKKIKPVLRERCFACHGALKAESELRLDTAESAIRGGASGAAVSASKPEESLLWQRITSKDDGDRMPPEGEPLKPDEIAAIREWIAAGAPVPADEVPESDPRSHWAFQTPVRPKVPNGTPAETNPIDAFLNARLASEGLTPQAPAERRLWLRRVTLDLTGLPPTLEELEAFEADTSPDSRLTVVNRLLATPQYGERWGRHWMDIWRYSDWWGLGAEVRNSQKHIWHWRDWIIESLNKDVGYDQMLADMLAVDELAPNDMDRLRAGGFLARQYFKFNRTTWMDGLLEHTSKAMLGLTVNCAKCHDHKYDPITAEDYYALRAIFEPYQIRTDATPGVLDAEVGGIPRPFDGNAERPTYIHIRGDDRNPDTSRAIEPNVPAILDGVEFAIEPVHLPAEAYQPGLRSFVIEEHRRLAAMKLETARKQQTTALSGYQSQLEQLARLEAPVSALRPERPDDRVVITETFRELRADRWHPVGGDFQIVAEGLAQQSLEGPRSSLRLTDPVPGDFEATLTYLPTGGRQWKSVGIAFDVVESGDHVLVYASGYAGGPKVQVSYTRDQQPAYPGEGAKAVGPIEMKPQTLTIRVRDQLVNVIFNDSLVVAYRLPVARSQGSLELVTYDATATFTTFELSALDPAETLVEPGGEMATAAVPSREQLELSKRIADQNVVVAEREASALEAKVAADAARYGSDAKGEAATNAIRTAVEAERRAKLGGAELAAMKAELDLLKSADAERAKFEQALAAARKSVETVRETLASPDGDYTPLAGALKTLESNNETEESRRKPFPSTSTGRRAAFARWLIDRRNPLTARVAVNHLWGRHFGKPLVATVFDFGRRGSPPTHPELLDWLAVEFMENGWSMKHLHRLMLTSDAYARTSSSVGAPLETVENDAENRWYWRMNPLRMEAQAVRDSLLSLSGELDPEQGGPSIPVNDTKSRRRSLYFVHSHNDHHEFLATFDDANVLECYRRAESIVPQQALALENSPLANEAARTIAKRLDGQAPDDREFVRLAFLAVLASEPTAAEYELLESTLQKLQIAAEARMSMDARLDARTGIIRALLNHNDFVTIR